VKKDLIQIAGIIDQAEATLLTECGANYLGFPLRLDVHAEDLSERDAASIIRSLALPVRAVLITYLDDAAAVVELCRRLGCTIVQLHGNIHALELARLRSMAPQLEVIKSLVVRGDNRADLVELATRLAPHVDAFITDTFDSSTGASGATGRTHDWSISRRLVELGTKPVILAGGLKAENVGDAIRVVRPAGVDAHTGLEDGNGRKDPRLVKQFVDEARKAFASLP